MKRPSITLFASPKPFKGHSGIIQRNAYRSWAKLGCEVLVMGDSEGGAEICRELGFRHLPVVEKSPHGPPLLSSLWSLAREHASNDIICYVNSDIVLF
ncbi:MAG TPA: glycosyltransferase family A protein, partial [Byssovorax sp.]